MRGGSALTERITDDDKSRFLTLTFLWFSSFLFVYSVLPYLYMIHEAESILVMFSVMGSFCPDWTRLLTAYSILRTRLWLYPTPSPSHTEVTDRRGLATILRHIRT